MPSPRTQSLRPSSGASRLHFLDGLRALACLYVLFFHELTVKVVGHGDPSRVMQFFLPSMNRGRYGVVVFIVLSGFSLMLPVARSGSIRLAGGFGNYMYRRIRRIFPPYYAALVLSIASIVGYNALGTRHTGGAPIEAALEPGSIISHFFLIHNINFEWAYRINGPMWSVATEWQIYFIFPALLLPLWRRVGGFATASLAWIVGSLPFFLLPADSNFFWACPWFVGSFTLGMAGAVLGVSPKWRNSTALGRVPWVTLTLVLFGVIVMEILTRRVDSWSYPIVDLMVSVFAFCWINAAVRSSAAREAGADGGAMLGVLGSRALVYLGGFSYSLYLVQHPILRFTEKVFSRMPLSYDGHVVVHVLVDTPLVIAVAWVFSELFERPFTSGAVLLPLLQRRLGVRPFEAS